MTLALQQAVSGKCTHFCSQRGDTTPLCCLIPKLSSSASSVGISFQQTHRSIQAVRVWDPKHTTKTADLLLL